MQAEGAVSGRISIFFGLCDLGSCVSKLDVLAEGPRMLPSSPPRVTCGKKSRKEGRERSPLPAPRGCMDVHRRPPGDTGQVTSLASPKGPKCPWRTGAERCAAPLPCQSLDPSRSCCNPLTARLSPVASCRNPPLPAPARCQNLQVAGPEPLTVAALWGKRFQVLEIFSPFKFELH